MATSSSLTERKSSYFHRLSKSLTNDSQYLFESKYKSSHTIKYDDVWADNIEYCENTEKADLFTLNNPNIVKKYEKHLLTEIPGSNGQAWYINDNKFVRSFISPVDVPDKITNLPSIGFEVKLYKEDGSIISPTSGVWYVDYYSGIIHFESSNTPKDLNYGIPKITIYAYIGKTLSDTINELKNTQKSTKIITSNKIKIINNECLLEKAAKGDIIYNTARVYDDLNSLYFIEYNCNTNNDGTKVIFEISDNLNDKYAVLSYMSDD